MNVLKPLLQAAVQGNVPQPVQPLGIVVRFQPSFLHIQLPATHVGRLQRDTELLAGFSLFVHQRLNALVLGLQGLRLLLRGFQQPV